MSDVKVLDSRGRTKVTPGFPIGTIIPFYGNDIPVGWSLCDGTNGTFDLRDRVIYCVSAYNPALFVASGSTSPTSAPTHTNGSILGHANHTVVQPDPHPDHSVTQPDAHANHAVVQPDAHGSHAGGGAHTHDAHTPSGMTTSVSGGEVTTPATHSSDGGHAHNAHSVHTGMAVTPHDSNAIHSGMTVDPHPVHSDMTIDPHSAHSVTQANPHSAYKHYVQALIERIF